jgi:sec-independent protein translocase protein TatB
MPSLGDSAVIILLGLLLFGPKGLAQIARQLGKLMGEFRRASNEFRMQMEEELRLSEQADRQKEIAAIEAAAPPPAPVLGSPDLADADGQMRSIHPDHTPAEMTKVAPEEATPEVSGSPIEPLPIAVSGDLAIMPPSTGLPQPRTSSSLAPLVDSVPHGEPIEAIEHDHSDQRPNRYANGHTDPGGLAHTDPAAAESPAQESLHG